jgi:hypothetical protein
MTTVEHGDLREQVERTLNENRTAIRVSAARAQRREEAARESMIAVERARNALRRAGLLRRNRA